MKFVRRMLAVLLTILLTSQCTAFAFPEELKVHLGTMELVQPSQEEASDTHVYLAVEVELTNWKTSTISLEKVMKAEIVYREKYRFPAELSFSHAYMEPLVQLHGHLMFRLPNMLANGAPEELTLVLTVEGVESMHPVAFQRGFTEHHAPNIHEGSGFDSPEEAILAYLSARSTGDLNAVMSTFAIETYVEHYDGQAVLEAHRTFSVSEVMPLPLSNDYTRQMKIVDRQMDIVDELALQYIHWLWPQEEYALDNTGRLFLTGRGEESAQKAKTLLEAFDVEGREALEAIAPQFVGFEEDVLEKMDVSDVTKERYIEQLENYRVIYGCEEIVEKVARVQQGGLDGYLFMRCARYGGRWYNLSSEHTLLVELSGHSSMTAGLIFESIYE